MTINNKFYSDTEAAAYIKELEGIAKRQRDIIQDQRKMLKNKTKTIEILQGKLRRLKGSFADE